MGNFFDDLIPMATQFLLSTGTAGIADAFYAAKKVKNLPKGTSPIEAAAIGIDRAVDPGGVIDTGIREAGSVLPQEVRNVAPAIGTTVGGIVGSYVPVLGTAAGAAIGAGVGAKVKGGSYTEGFLTSAAAYLGSAAGSAISGAGAGAGASGSAGEAAGLAAESNFAADALIYGGPAAEGMGYGSGLTESALLGEALVYGAPSAIEGGVAAESGLTAAEAASLGAKETSVIDKLLSNKKLMDYVVKAGKAGVNMANPEQGAVVAGGSSSSREPQSQIQNQELNAMMKEALGTDQSSTMFNTASVTPIKETEKNVLYKSFLSGDNKSSLTSTKVGGDLAFRTKKSKLSDKKSKSYDDEYTYSGLKNISIASPFY